MARAMTKTRPERPRSTTPSAAGLPSPGGAALYAAYHDDLGGFETHRAAMAWIEPGARVVDVGCSTGFFARHLVEEKGCRVIGIERDARAAAEARKACERVYVGNLEDPTFLEAIDSQGDVIFFGDVLEHLGDPRPVLLRAHEWLTSGGFLICSVPNVAYWKIRFELLRGRFEYQDVGILDRTHLRFYTRKSFERLIGEVGYRIVEVSPVCSDRDPLGFRLPRPERPPSRVGAALALRWPGLFATQYLFRALPVQPREREGVRSA